MNPTPATPPVPSRRPAGGSAGPAATGRATVAETEAYRWYRLTADDAARALDVDPDRGLAPAEAAARLARYGPNELQEAPKRASWLVFLDQFRNFLIIILLIAAVVSLVVSRDVKTPIVIAVVVFLNAILGYIQEHRAEQSLEALRSMLVVHARVRRGGTVTQVPASEIVPGDVVLVEAGDRIPADGRLLVAANLEIEEAAITGESQPSVKSTEPVFGTEVALGDRLSVAYMNTTVTRGRGELLVTATGMATEIGTIAGLLRETPIEKTPLQHQLDHLGHLLAGLAGVVLVIVFVIGLIRGDSFSDLFLTAVALAVAMVPEGLPAVVAVTLALGTYRMARQHAIVKRLASVETLGCTSVICSDKTGTLTLNQMTVRAVWFRGRRFRVTGEGYGTAGSVSIEPSAATAPDPDLAEMAEPLALANDAAVREGALVGDPTEGALVVLASKAGVDPDRARAERPRVAEVPFDSATKFMATVHAGADGATVELFAKGAPDVLETRCSRILDEHGDEVPMDDGWRARIEAVNGELARQGLRVLAVARRRLPRSALVAVEDPAELVTELTFLGLAGILDPPRPEARDAIAECRQAGIRVRMITGDHAETAAAIGAELGIEGGAMTGAELERLDDAELAARIDDVGVFARVAPEHKIKLVRVQQAKGNVVAMTGDGVNDAPALKAADIGVAMGITGTEVTKEAATMVLTDDNFATIVAAVRQGRTIYDNIVKFVRFQLATTLGFGATFLAASAFDIAGGKPFTAIQILWVNIIMDGPPAMALGVDEPARDIMQRKPRPMSEKILEPGRFALLVWFGLVMAAGALGVYLANDTTLNAAGASVAGTMAFTTFVVAQFFNILNARSERLSVFARATFTNDKLWMALGAVAVLQIAAVQLPLLQSWFGTTGLTLTQWGVCVAVASTVLWIEEARKLALRLLRRPGYSPVH